MVQSLSRTERSTLENRIGEAIPDEHLVLTWIVRELVSLRNRFHIGPDRRTPWERAARKRSGASASEFGEKVMEITRWPNKERQWAFGTWLGQATRTLETDSGTPDEVMRARHHTATRTATRRGGRPHV